MSSIEQNLWGDLDSFVAMMFFETEFESLLKFYLDKFNAKLRSTTNPEEIKSIIAECADEILGIFHFKDVVMSRIE